MPQDLVESCTPSRNSSLAPGMSTLPEQPCPQTKSPTRLKVSSTRVLIPQRRTVASPAPCSTSRPTTTNPSATSARLTTVESRVPPLTRRPLSPSRRATTKPKPSRPPRLASAAKVLAGTSSHSLRFRPPRGPTSTSLLARTQLPRGSCRPMPTGTISAPFENSRERRAISSR